MASLNLKFILQAFLTSVLSLEINKKLVSKFFDAVNVQYQIRRSEIYSEVFMIEKL